MTSNGRLVALLDANVLYPALTRGIFLELAYREIFSAKWSRHIEEEWTRSLRRQRPDLDPSRVERTRRLMSLHFPGALVTGYEGYIDQLTLPDPDDRHVLAAAIAGDCDIIVTQNLKDFPMALLEIHGIEAQRPDDFLLHQLDSHGEAFLAAVDDTRATLRNPAYNVDQFLENLRKQNLKKTAEALGRYSERLD